MFHTILRVFCQLPLKTLAQLHLFESEDFRYIKAPKEIMGYCMVYNCVRYCGATMKDWSDQLVRLPHPCPRAIFLGKLNLITSFLPVCYSFTWKCL
jgi:hypothetical protein